MFAGIGTEPKNALVDLPPVSDCRVCVVWVIMIYSLQLLIFFTWTPPLQILFRTEPCKAVMMSSSVLD